MGVPDWSYATNQSLGVLRCSRDSADEAESEFVLCDQLNFNIIAWTDSPLYRARPRRPSPLRRLVQS